MFELLNANARHGPISGTWVHGFSVQLRTAYRELTDCCSLRKLQNSRPKFTRQRLSLLQLNDTPYFKGKAHNTFIVCKWMVPVPARFHREHPSRREETKLATWFGYLHFVDVRKAADLWLRPQELQEVKRAKESALFSRSH